ncbi:MAG: LysR substrate-binding domain-containing protein [Pseudomonadales bacterium]
MRFTLRQIEVFLETAKQQNISSAASALAMSQSAASGALKSLEERYGVQLFDRIGKRLQLNEMGRNLRPRAQAVHDQATQLHDELTGSKGASALTIGATLTIGNYLAVDLMAKHLRANPEAQLKLHVANTENIAAGLLNLELDVALLEGEVQHRDLDLIEWQSDELLVFASPDHPLANKTSLNDSDLQSACWILREPGSGTRQTFDRAMHGLLPTLDVFMELEHTEAIKRAVEANLGLSCLSAICLAPALERGDVVALNVPHRDLSRNFYIGLHRQKQRSRAIEDFLLSCNA